MDYSKLPLLLDFESSFKKIPLGLQLNNYGCLRSSSSQWKGKVGSKRGFCVFDSPCHGIRALTLVLCKYVFSYHLFDVFDICNRYAPQSDGDVPKIYANDPKIYADFVSKKLGFRRLSTNINTLKIQFPLLVYSITCMELGNEYEEKSKKFKNFISWFFENVDNAFDEYLNNVYFPVYGKVPNIYL